MEVVEVDLVVGVSPPLAPARRRRRRSRAGRARCRRLYSAGPSIGRSFFSHLTMASRHLERERAVRTHSVRKGKEAALSISSPGDCCKKSHHCRGSPDSPPTPSVVLAVDRWHCRSPTPARLVHADSNFCSHRHQMQSLLLILPLLLFIISISLAERYFKK